MLMVAPGARGCCGIMLAVLEMPPAATTGGSWFAPSPPATCFTLIPPCALRAFYRDRHRTLSGSGLPGGVPAAIRKRLETQRRIAIGKLRHHGPGFERCATVIAHVYL